MPTLPRRVLLGIYIAFLVIPLYWLVVMSLKTNEEGAAPASPWITHGRQTAAVLPDES